jgi:DNA-binding response OmpR family regulator
VDDHDDTSFMLSHLLEQSNYEVETTNNLDDALRLARTRGFDLYVLDKRFPGGTGLELCERLNYITPDIPVIFYSGDAYETHRQEGLRAGAQAYVPKPCIDELIDTVHQLLSQRECATALSY